MLKSLPLAVQQKQIIVTCNYEARRRGLYKLQLIKDAKRICPDVVIVLGEDLTRFRNASKDLYSFVKDFIWGGRVERLGFDELFLDVTEMIDYNAALLNLNDLTGSFFHLDRSDPTVGFAYDASRFCGQTYPSSTEETSVTIQDRSSLQTRLLVASHLLGYLRSHLEHEKGFTATGGVSTSKLLAKLVGSVHKPNGQTILLPPYITTNDDIESNVIQFLDAHEIRKIPGIGSRLTQKLKSRVCESDSVNEEVTVRDVRLFPGMGPAMLEKTLGGPGSAKGIGMRVWCTLHGVDNTEVLEARDLPTQISIEDSYGQLDNFETVRRELVTLAKSLIRRMRTDLLDHSEESPAQPRWLAHPRTLRLSTRPRVQSETEGIRTYHANRISRSAPLPTFIFHLDEQVDALAERIVRDHLLSMFRKLHPEKSGWNLSLMNIAVTNMVESAGDQKQSSGRDIGKMFQRQETILKEWTVQDYSGDSKPPEPPTVPQRRDDGDVPLSSDGDGEWEAGDEDGGDEPLMSVECSRCGAAIAHFAQVAHELYHAAEDASYDG